MHASSLYNTGVSGLLVVGTVQTSESDPNNLGISVGNVPTIEEEEDPEPAAEDGQPKVRVCFVCVCVCVCVCPPGGATLAGRVDTPASPALPLEDEPGVDTSL